VPVPTTRSILAVAAAALCLLVPACSDDGTGAADGVDDGPEESAGTTGGTTTAPDDGPVASAGCGTSTTRAVTSERRTVTGPEGERWYLLTTPEGHDGRTPLPLVIDYHGLAEGAEVHTRMSSYGELARREGFVVAVPQGQGAVPGWRFTTTEDNPDLAFTDAVLDQLESELCIDTSRVYAAGLSNGAFMASAVACTRPERFAAIAPVAGVMHVDPCDPGRPVPVMAFHGTADPILLFNGGIGDLAGPLSGRTPTTGAVPPPDLEGPGYPEAVREWARTNGCGPTPTETRVTDAVLHRVYACPEGGDVEFYVIEGGGHSWPGSEFNRSIERFTGPTNMDLDATALSWEFFRRFRLPA
jgi:polyhydroxybutyrate depolymerase